MKNRIITAVFAASLLITPFAYGADDSGTTEAKAELQTAVGKIREKFTAGKKSAADLQENLKELQTLAAKYKDSDKETAALFGFVEADVYVRILEDFDKAGDILSRVQKDFPGTEAAASAEKYQSQLKGMEEAKKVQRALAIGAKFPDFDEKDLDGKPLSVANYKGKVVLVDFWATWCPPCRAELPNVLNVYKKYHDKGFEIIGISLDQSQSRLESFIKEQKMTWVQYFDGKGWGNKLSNKYGVQSIPATFLLDGEGKIIGRDLRGDELEAAVAKALKQ